MIVESKRRPVSWLNKERLFFATCALFAAFAGLRMARGADPRSDGLSTNPIVPPSATWSKEDLEFQEFSWELTTANLARLLPKRDRLLFRAVSEATSLPPVDLPVPTTELNVVLRYPPVPAFLVESRRYLPDRPEYTPLLAIERAKEKFVWIATVSFQGGPPEVVRVFAYEQDPERLTVSRAEARPITYKPADGEVKLIKIGPSPSETYYQKADAAQEKGGAAHLAMARWCLTNADPDDEFRKTLIDRAAHHLQMAIRTDPKASLPYLLLAELGEEAGGINRALEALLRAGRAGVRDARIHVRIGLLLCRLTLWESARKQFEAAAADKAHRGIALCYLGETYLKTGAWDKAEKLFNEAATLQGASMTARGCLGLAALLRKANGETDLPLILPNDTDPLSIAAKSGLAEARINRVAALLLDDRPQAAAAYAKSLLAPAPDARLAANWVLALAADARLGEAESELKRLSNEQPVMQQATAGFSRRRLLRGYLDALLDTPERLESAVEKLRAVRRASGGLADSRFLPAVQYMLAFCHYRLATQARTDEERLKRYSLAEDAFLKALRYGYDAEASLTGAAQCAVSQVQARSRAEEYLARAVQVNPANASLRKKLTELYLLAKEKEDEATELAEHLARRLVADDPQDPVAVAFLAIVEYRNRNTGAAARLLEELPAGPGGTKPMFISSLSALIGTNRSRTRYRFEFKKPDSPKVGWEWVEQESDEAGIVIEVRSEAVHLRVAGGQRALEPHMSKTVAGETLVSFSADMNADAAADGAVGISIAVVPRSKPTDRGSPGGPPRAISQVTLFKSARGDQGGEQVSYEVIRGGAVAESGVLGAWPRDGFHNLKIEVTEQQTFLFRLDGRPLGGSKGWLDLSGGRGRSRPDVVVRVFGRAAAGRAWYAVVDNIEIVQQRLTTDG